MSGTQSSHSSSLALLRRKAEERLRQKEQRLPRMSRDAMRALIHELQVHQIELQMQNEQLRLTQEELEEARERYVELFDLAPVGYLTLDREGVILQANITSETMLALERSRLLTMPFSLFVFRPDRRKYQLWWPKIF